MKKLRIYGEIWGSTVGMGLAAGAALSLFAGMNFQGAESCLLQTAAIYVMVAGCMITLVMPFSLYQTYVPMILFMNGRRREIFRMIQILKYLNVAGITAVGALFMALQNILLEPVEGAGLLIGIGCCILLVSSSLGNLAGALYNRFGKIAVIIFMICCGVCGGIIGYFSAAGFKGKVPELVQRIIDGNAKLTVLGIAVVFCVLDGVLSWLSFRKMEVRC